MLKEELLNTFKSMTLEEVFNYIYQVTRSYIVELIRNEKESPLIIKRDYLLNRILYLELTTYLKPWSKQWKLVDNQDSRTELLYSKGDSSLKIVSLEFKHIVTLEVTSFPLPILADKGDFLFLVDPDENYLKLLTKKLSTLYPERDWSFIHLLREEVSERLTNK